jgi:hypothetical protein
MMAAEEEARHARLRREAKGLEEKRAEEKRAQEEQTLLREAVRKRPGPNMVAPRNSPEKGNKRN